jgi:ribonuclease P protein component
VVHLLVASDGDGARPVQVGFVVSRAVGNAVVRHRVQRRLRHLCRERLAGLPSGSQAVVRALAPAAHASYPELGADLDRCLLRVLGDRPVREQGSVS